MKGLHFVSLPDDCEDIVLFMYAMIHGPVRFCIELPLRGVVPTVMRHVNNMIDPSRITR